MTSMITQPERDTNASDERPADCACTHCGLPVPRGLLVAGRDQQFCCQGCASVYEVIHGCGLDAYYRLRDQSDSTGQAVKPTDCDRIASFDTDKFSELYVRTRDDGMCVVDLMLEGVHCAACVCLPHGCVSVDCRRSLAYRTHS